MNIHEYQAKEILSRNGIKIPEGRIAYTAQEAYRAAKTVSQKGPWVLKAQIHSGARSTGHFIEKKAGSEGGIRVVRSLDDVRLNAEEMLGATLVTTQTGEKGRQVNRIYVEVFEEVVHTFYLGMAIDRTIPSIILLSADTKDGDITDIAANHTERILRVPVGLEGPDDTQTKQVADFLNLPKESFANFHKFICNMFKAFSSTDALMIEINPVGVLKNNEIIALDAKIIIDNKGLLRHPELERLKDDCETEIRELKASRYGFSYNEYDGNIGCIVNGTGLALAMIDLLKHSNNEMACSLNVKGSVDRDKIAAGIKIIATNPKVEGIIIYILGGFLRCDLIADGIIDAAAEVGMNIPLVVRFEGTNRDEARSVLEQAKLPLIMAENMEDAVSKIIKAVEDNE